MKNVCLNMIVKNEAAILRKALASLVHEIDYYVICDTGSSDIRFDYAQRAVCYDKF